MNTKQKITCAAGYLFWMQGYKNTSINEIIEKSEVSKGSFFHHFPDKKSLFMAVVDCSYEKEVQPSLEKYFQKKEIKESDFIDFCRNINDKFIGIEFKGGCLFGNLALELTDLDLDFQKKLDETFTRWRDSLIEAAQRNCDLETSEDIADYIIWGIEGITLTAKVHKNKDRNKKEFGQFIKGLHQFFLNITP